MKKPHCKSCTCRQDKPSPSRWKLPTNLLLKALLLSLVIHLFSVKGCALLGGGGNSEEGEEQGEGSGNRGIEPKASPITLVVPEDLGEEVIKPENKRTCPNGSYGGLGIYLSIGNSSKDVVVEYAFPGYLGAQLGLRPGYRVTSKEEIKHPKPGAELDLVIYPNDGKPVRKVRVARDEICVQGGNTVGGEP